MILSLIATVALAGPTFYDPDAVARESAQVGRARDVLSVKFEKLSGDASEIGRALEDWHLAIDALGESAPSGEAANLATADKQYRRERAVAEAFTAELVGRFEDAALAAVDRAAAGAVECASSGGGLPIPGRMKGRGCEGDDRSAAISKAIDEDPALKKVVDEVLAMDWPKVQAGGAPLDVGGPWADLAGFLHVAYPRSLSAIDLIDETARLPLAEAVENGASKEALAQLQGQAQQIAKVTALGRAALLAPLAPSLTGAALCPRPKAFGGCVGEDHSGPAIERWLGDKKVAKAIAKIEAKAP